MTIQPTKIIDFLVPGTRDLALERKSGARGLRAIIENCMLNVMYDIPSNPSIKEVIITPEVVREEKEPIIVYHSEVMAS